MMKKIVLIRHFMEIIVMRLVITFILDVKNAIEIKFVLVVMMQVILGQNVMNFVNYVQRINVKTMVDA